MVLILALAVGVFALIVVANLAEQWAWARWLVQAALLAVDLTLVVAAASLLVRSATGPLPPIVEGAGPPNASVLLLALWGSALGTTLVLWTPFRRLLARFLAVRADSPLHTTALALAVWAVGWVVWQWGAIGGTAGLGRGDLRVSSADLLLTAVLTFTAALLGVGWGTRRSGRAVLERLALRLPRRRHWRLAASATVLLLGAQWVMSAFWFAFSPESLEQFGEVSRALFGGFTSLEGALLASVLPAFSEEILFRGALQPRFRLLPTAALFAVVHVQYLFSPATLLIFVVGIGLGLVRRQGDTTASILTHFGYNFVNLLLAMLASQAGLGG